MATDTQQGSKDDTGDRKPVHTILLDASPILLNTPAISTLLANCDSLVTTAAVISEIRGEEARNRLEILYKPFLTMRSPNPQSVKHVRDFARRTGDLAVLSVTDIEVLALAYDLECERNGGDWRLKNSPGQKRLNGKPPVKEKQSESRQVGAEIEDTDANVADLTGRVRDVSLIQTASQEDPSSEHKTTSAGSALQDDSMENTGGSGREADQRGTSAVDQDVEVTPESVDEADDGSGSEEGWITPSNIKKHQSKEQGSKATGLTAKHLQVATMTGDFAMQNVLLQMNLNLLSTKTCRRITHIKQTLLRCHGCFATTRDMSKQFCPRCGKPTLTRVTSTTNEKGEVKLHLKSDFQWNNRGNVYSIPKPVSGSSNQKWKGPQAGGGKGGWGSGLVLAEDQKEYIRAKSTAGRAKEQNLMDEDVLPSILSGQRHGGRDSVRTGAGRNVNKVSRKR